MKDTVVIQIATQLPITNTKAVPWNYNKVFVTRKGKEIIKETNETRGLTHIGRFYAPKELKRDKQIKQNQLPMKKPVIEEDAKDFLKKKESSRLFCYRSLEENACSNLFIVITHTF